MKTYVKAPLTLLLRRLNAANPQLPTPLTEANVRLHSAVSHSGSGANTKAVLEVVGNQPFMMGSTEVFYNRLDVGRLLSGVELTRSRYATTHQAAEELIARYWLPLSVSDFVSETLGDEAVSLTLTAAPESLSLVGSITLTLPITGEPPEVEEPDPGEPPEVEEPDPDEETGPTPVDPPEGRMYARLAVLNDEIYMVGGVDEEWELARGFYKYNPAQDQWYRLADEPFGIEGAVFLQLDGKLYLYSGALDWDAPPSNQLWEYAPEDDQWYRKADGPQAVYEPGATVHGGKIYVYGGMLDTGAASRYLQVYDPVTDAWSVTYREDIPAASLCSLTVLMDDVIAIWITEGDDGRMLDELHAYQVSPDSALGRIPLSTPWSYEENKHRGISMAFMGNDDIFLFYMTDNDDDTPHNRVKAVREEPVLLYNETAGTRYATSTIDALLDGKLYLFGGEDAVTYELRNDFHVIDLMALDGGPEIVLTISPNDLMTYIASGTRLYALWGEDEEGRLQDDFGVMYKEKLDSDGYIVEDVINVLKGAPPARRNFAFAELDGKLYIYGGQNDQGHSFNEFWCYDTQTNVWTSLPTTITVALHGGHITVHNGKLYFYGGTLFDGRPARSLVRFDPETGYFDVLHHEDPDSPSVYNSDGFFMDDQHYHVFGEGLDGDGLVASRLDLESGKWLTRTVWLSHPRGEIQEYRVVDDEWSRHLFIRYEDGYTDLYYLVGHEDPTELFILRYIGEFTATESLRSGGHPRRWKFFRVYQDEAGGISYPFLKGIDTWSSGYNWV